MTIQKLILCSLLPSVAGMAQTPLSLSAALNEALASNPRLTAGEARVAVAEGQRRQAGTRPNPRLFLQTEDVRPWNNNFSYSNGTEDYAYVGQTIESAGKRMRRVQFAQTLIERAQLEQQVLARQIRGAVSLAYWSASSAAYLRDLYNESLQTYERDVSYCRNRVAEGQMAEADLIRVELERDKVQAQAVTADRDAERALLALYRAMARTDFSPVKLVTPIENQPLLEIPDIATAVAGLPETKTARQALEQAMANARLQRANGVPDPDVFFGYKRNSGANTLYAAVQVPLPISNRNQGNVAAAEAELRASRAELVATEASLRAELETAVRVYRANRKLVEALPATRARAEETARIAREAYRLGGIDLLRLLDAERSRIDAQVAYYHSFAQLQQSVVDLLLASGQQFPAEINLNGVRP